MKLMFFPQIHAGHNYWRNSYESNISYSHYNFDESRAIMNMKLISHGFLFHGNINRRENKAQIP